MISIGSHIHKSLLSQTPEMSDTDQQLIDEWTIWGKAVPVEKGERRDIAVLRLKECLKFNSLKLCLSHLNLSQLPKKLPTGLKELDIQNNDLTRLSDNLPISLKILNTCNNQLTHLPDNLPDSLKVLHVSDNHLDDLPEKLPTSLEELYIRDNGLMNLPDNLPGSLLVLDVGSNRLTRLPENLPLSLKGLAVDNNALARLPENLSNQLEKLDVKYNNLTHLPDRLPALLQLLDASNNELTHLAVLPDYLKYLYINHNQIDELPARLPRDLIFMKISDNPLRNVSTDLQGFCLPPYSGIRIRHNTAKFIEQIQFWTEELEPWHAIKAQEHTDVFGDFLQKLSLGKNEASKVLKPRVANWLNYLAKEENSELRKCTFLIAREATESCVDRASFYFNNMYTALLEDALIKENAPLERIINTILSLFRMQVLEKIAAATSAKRRCVNPDFSEDIEIYLAYQYKLRDKLSLPVYTELQFETEANLTYSELNAAIDSLFEQEKSHFLRYLVMQSGCWNAKLEQWDKEKKQAVEESYLQEIAADKLEERVDNVLIQQGIAKDDIDGRRLVSKQLADELLYQKRYQLSRQFLTAHEALNLIDRF